MKIELIITRKVLFEKHSIEEDMNGFFLPFLDGCEIKVIEDYPDSIFYVKNDKFLFEQEIKNKYFSIRYDQIWSVFESKYQMEHQQIQAFIKGLLETHLKLEGYTPLLLPIPFQHGLETHLKLEGYTPKGKQYVYTQGLETHLKLEGYTPIGNMSMVGFLLEDNAIKKIINLIK